MSARSPSRESIEAWLVSKLAGLLEIDPGRIDRRESFAGYGLSSTDAVGLSGELEEWLGCRLPATLAYDYPTIELLARHLAGEETPGNVAGEEIEKSASPGLRGEIEPIAIIGIGCRFPGASGPEGFWRLLREGVDVVSEVPGDRWDVDAFYDPDPTRPGKMNTRWGGFLEQVDRFDAPFFGITPREARRMDPQQRLLLEVAWEALEDAGQAPDHLAGTRTGVFIGISSGEYGWMQLGDPELGDAYAGTGSAMSIAANRLSYLFDFAGPSMAVDTACSSSLVAVHLAARSLWDGEATLALAGGVNLILQPALTVNFSKAGFMAPDGRCKAFDARADGYVRGEGAGLVVLKPLSRALADRDPIYALIRGSAVNQDGRSNGLTAPSRHAQEAVLRQAYQRSGLSPAQVQYIEAHGTGTALGDPIEAQALGAVLADGRSPGSRCVLGSVKTNIGHLEAAAGIAGLIKVALMLKHRAIPPSLHFQDPNPRIPFDELPLRVARSLEPWPEGVGPALAGVSSFGFGGTNAHVVLSAFDRRWTVLECRRSGLASSDACTRRYSRAPFDDALKASTDARALLLPISARDPRALSDLAQAYREAFGARASGDPEPCGGSAVSLADVCYTASLRRNAHDERLAVVFQSAEELGARLGAFLNGESDPALFSGRRKPGASPRPVFVFPGQGPQWWGMGRSLLEQEPVFRETIAACDDLFRRDAGWSILEELTAPEPRSRLEETEVAQPVLFALQVALAALWRSWGIRPAAVVGHSLGEVAAAHVAGALSLPDAVRVVFHRGRLMQRATGQGRMAAVAISAEEARVAGEEGRLAIAAMNSPTATVLAGDPERLEAALRRFEEAGIRCRRLPVNYAFHSPWMEPLQAELAEALAGIAPRPASLPILSTLTGSACAGTEFDAAYWGRQIREPVRFSDAVAGLPAEPSGDLPALFLELGPHPVLAGAISEIVGARGETARVLPSLRRGEEGRAVMLGSLGALYTLGAAIDWRGLYPEGGRCVRLPSYPWQRRRYWIDLKPRPAEAEEHRLETESRRGGSEPEPPSRSMTPRERVLSVAAQARQEELVALFRGHLGRALGIPASELDVLQPLTHLGLDSLMALELKSRLEGELGVAVPMVEFLRGPSIVALAGRVAELLAAGGNPEAANGGAGPDSSAAVDALSDAEVDALLRRLLEAEEVSG